MIDILKLFSFGENGWSVMFLEGLVVTIQVASLSFIVAIVIGLLGAAGQNSTHKALQNFWYGYSTIVRCLPEVLVVFIVFFGGTAFIRYLGTAYHDFFLHDISAFVASVIALGCLSGAYAIEVLRGAFRAIPQGQVEAARALGMSRALIFRRIKLPQMIKYALPGLSNQWLVMLKDTALVSMIGLDDLVRKGTIASGSTLEPFVFYSAVAVLYLLLTFVSIGGIVLINRYAQRGELKTGNHWV